MLPMIDPVKGWFDCVALNNKPTTDEVHWLFDNMWLEINNQRKWDSIMVMSSRQN